MRRLLLLSLALAVVAGGTDPTTGPREPACVAEPVHDPSITTPEEHAAGFPAVEITSDQIVDYVHLVDTQSDRVVAGDFGTSIGGTELVYALVSTPENLARVDEIAATQERLRDPRVTDATAAETIATEAPAIVWYSGNVHGNEPSGADAAVSILHDLAARTDCEVDEILDDLVVGIMPTQNPDGRDNDSRQNLYGFDMNRDWFAGSQPETAGKLELLRRYPPVLFIDAHEMGGSQFFFPPNADPIHHEISDTSLHWINEVYGASIAAAFDERASGSTWDYFSYNVYDLFYMGYGDSMPTTAYGAAGMTFEKGGSDNNTQRHDEQYVAGWVSIQQAAANKDDILREHYASHVDAIADGAAGRLEANLVVEPQNEVAFEVPDQTVRNYYLLADGPEGALNRLVDRLQRTKVEVYRLTEDLVVPDLRHYGRPAAEAVVPAGSYWIPMEQPQKRWIQALLGEDPYTPFPYFYDVTSWSNPLLMDVPAALSGADLTDVVAEPVVERPGFTLLGEGPTWAFAGDSVDAVAAALRAAYAGLDVQRDTTKGRLYITGDQADVVAAVERFPLTLRTGSLPAEGVAPVAAPRIAVLDSSGESARHLRFTLEQWWGVPVEVLTAPQLALGTLSLEGYDVLVVPGVSTSGLEAAGPAIELWIESGGTFIGTQRGSSGGTSYAVAQGWTTATSTPLSGAQVGGTAFRMVVDPSASPVTLGADGEAFWFNLRERVLSPSTTGANAITYAEGEDFWFSGYGTGVEPLAGTAGLVHEQLGDGDVVLFSGEANYRAYTEGPLFFLANAIVAASGVDPLIELPVDSPLAAADVAAARASALTGWDHGPHRPISLEVARRDLDAVRSVLSTFTTSAPFVEATGRGTVLIELANPEGLDWESHPFLYRLRPALDAVGVHLVSALF